MDFFHVRLRNPFPKLNEGNHRKTSPETATYNCFGWAILGREVAMGPKKGWLWPSNVPADLRLSSFLLALAQYGFEACPTGELDPAFEKIALYGGGEHVTHAAWELESGHWTSKRGIYGDDIEHDTAEAITGGEYFEILAYFQRPRIASPLMNDNLLYGFALLVAGYIFKIWLSDLRAYGQGKVADGELAPVVSAGSEPSPGRAPTFPGATPVGLLAIVVAVVGALVLLAVETGGEYALGVDQQQSKMTVLFGLYTLAAAFVEELIFRGYLVYERGGKAELILSTVLISVVFAMLHPYLWQWKMPEGASSWEVWRGSLSLDLGNKALFSTTIVFVRSLWFYCVRFWPANPLRSLLPCIAAHLATNLGVFVLKAVQGHVTGLY